MLRAELDLAPADPGFGEMYGPGVAYVGPQGIAVWMWRKGVRVRFYDARGEQVGPEHKNIYPAIIWAAAHAWVDPASPTLSLACIAEVRRQIAERGDLAKLNRDLAKDIEEGSWDPASHGGPEFSVRGGDPKNKGVRQIGPYSARDSSGARLPREREPSA